MQRLSIAITILSAALALGACGTSTNDQGQQIEVGEPSGGGAGSGEPSGGVTEPGGPSVHPDSPVSNQPDGNATVPSGSGEGGEPGEGEGGEPGEGEGEGGEPGGLVVGDDACETDADCVPAECCHAAACVAQDNAPDCEGMMCTQECRYGTLDCGGKCLCHEGKCAARLSEPPEGVQDSVSPQ